jgi:hypothetical protein
MDLHHRGMSCESFYTRCCQQARTRLHVCQSEVGGPCVCACAYHRRNVSRTFVSRLPVLQHFCTAQHSIAQHSINNSMPREVITSRAGRVLNAFP